MYQLQQWAAVQELRRQNKGIRAIARELHMSRNTVKRLLSLTEEPKYRRTKTKSKLDPYKDMIIKWHCEDPFFNGTRILKEITKRGYKGSAGPPYRFLEELDGERGQISSKATVRVETLRETRRSSTGRNTRSGSGAWRPRFTVSH